MLKRDSLQPPTSRNSKFWGEKHRKRKEDMLLCWLMMFWVYPSLRSYDARKYAKQYSQIFSLNLITYTTLHKFAMRSFLEKIPGSSLNRSFLPSFEGFFTGCHWSLRLFFQHFKPFQATFLLLRPVGFFGPPYSCSKPIAYRDDPSSLGIYS